MSSASTVGHVDTLDKLEVEWKINKFSKLSVEPDAFYVSSVFAFLHSFWRLKIYPNGETKHKSEEFIGLYLAKEAEEEPVGNFEIKLSLKDRRDSQEGIVEGFVDDDWLEGCSTCGSPRFFERSKLMQQNFAEFVTCDDITILCILKTHSLHEALIGVPLLDRLLTLSRSLKGLLKEGRRTDVVLKVKGREIKAHRAILEARSSVFETMLSPGVTEDRTSRISIEDTEADEFQEVLAFVYSGRVENMSSRNACEIYEAADKYDLSELKEMCRQYMEDNISDENVCRIYSLADKYNLVKLKDLCEKHVDEEMSIDVFFDILVITAGENTELKEMAERYFRLNFATILETDKWMEFEKENSVAAIQLLKSALFEARRTMMRGGDRSRRYHKSRFMNST